MCIRDRVLNEQGEESISHGEKEDNTQVVATDNSTPAVGSTVQTLNYTSNVDSISNDVHIIMFIVVFSFCSVSYTHLDVYKRQVL